MSGSDKAIEHAALDWLVRVNDPAFDQWDAWDQWMAADATHADTYWRLAENEAEAVEALKTAPARSSSPVRTRRTLTFRRRTGLAAAIAAVVVGGVWFAWSDRPQPWSITTAPGEQRTITMADGSQVSLDGGTRLALDRRHPREVRLDAGRALFVVIHDDARPFLVDVGETTLTDLGTTFDVTRLADGARVSVSEGVVRVDAPGATATLNPGDSAIATSRGLERRKVSPEDVASWRAGRLTYSNERIAVVAEDLARTLNRRVMAAPELANHRFSGSLMTKAAPEELKERLAVLLGVVIVEDGESWRLEPRPAQ